VAVARFGGNSPAEANAAEHVSFTSNRLADGKIWLLTMYSKAIKSDVERKMVKGLREDVDD
jgi:hypothetical protein